MGRKLSQEELKEQVSAVQDLIVVILPALIVLNMVLIITAVYVIGQRLYCGNFIP